MNFRATCVGFVLAGALAGSACAGSVFSVLASQGGPQLWSDDSGDFLFNFEGGERTVDVGDVLIGQFRIDKISNLVSGVETALGLGTANHEFTGAFAIEVHRKVSVFDAFGNENFTWGFKPVSMDKRDIIAGVYAGIGGELLTWDERTMAAFYDDPSDDYTRLGGTLESTFATAVNGTRLFEAGFLTPLTDPNSFFTGPEGWIATAGDDNIDTIGNTPLPAAGGEFQFAVNVIPGTGNSLLRFENVASTFGGFVDINGSGNLIGTGGVDTPYDSFNRLDLAVNVSVVPEPASVVTWAGIALTGLFLRRNRRRKAVV